MLKKARLKVHARSAFRSAANALRGVLRIENDGYSKNENRGFLEVEESGERPARTSVPPLVPLSLAMWGSCAFSYTLLRGAGLNVAINVVAIGVGAALIFIIGSIPKKTRTAAFALAAISIGASLGGAGACEMVSAAEAFTGRTCDWTFELLEDSSPSDFGSVAAAKGTNKEGDSLKLRLYFSDENDLLTGAKLRATASPSAPKESSAEFFWSQGIAATARVKQYEVVEDAGPMGYVRNMRALAIGNFQEFGEEEAGILQALVCGYRNTIEQTGAYDDYKTCGLAHTVAVSGAHLAIVTMLFGWALRKCKAPLWLNISAILVFLDAYLVFAGIPISAIRAAFMVLLSVCSPLFKRRDASLNALALCIAVFLCVDPVTSVSVSFFLSAGSTMGIIMFAGLISSWFSALPRHLRTFVAEPLGLTLSSNVATLPFSMALFSQLSLVAPLANIAATPLFSIGCITGLIAAILSCALPVVAPVAIVVAEASVVPLCKTVSFLSGVPYACIATSFPVVPMIALSAAMCVVLWRVWPNFTLRFVVISPIIVTVLAILVFAVSPRLHGDEIIMLDVGQGDAFLLRSQGRAVLIDTGNQDGLLRHALGEFGVYDLDAVIVSHPDDDHCGSLKQLSGFANIGAVYGAADVRACPCKNCKKLCQNAEAAAGKPIMGLSVGDTMKLGAFNMKVIWPRSFEDEGGNSDSLCLLVTSDCDGDGESEWSAAFLGDAESEQTQQMVDSKMLGDVDVLKVGHHGSRVSLTPTLSEQLHPELALISVGANNRYGHPTQDVLDCLDDVEAKVLRTDEMGSVRLTFTKESIKVG